MAVEPEASRVQHHYLEGPIDEERQKMEAADTASHPVKSKRSKGLRGFLPTLSRDTVHLLVYRMLPVYLLRVLGAGVVSVIAVVLYNEDIVVIKDSTGISLMAAVVAFMILQRVSLAYNRFWEGRTAIALVQGLLTSAATFTISGIPSTSSEAVELKREIARRIALAFRSLVVYLRSISTKSEAYALDKAEYPMANEHEKCRLRQSKQPHFWAAMRIVKLVSTAFGDKVIDKDMLKELSPRLFGIYAPMEQTASKLVDLPLNTAADPFASQLASTPYPVPYTIIETSVVFLYVYTCPFYFVDTQGWLTVPFTLLVAFTFIGLHKTATLMEDPFGIDITDLLKDDQFEARMRGMLNEVITLNLPMEVKTKEA